MMTNTKMSVFNRYKVQSTGEIVYKRHIIDEVFWDDARGVNRNAGYENADSVNVYIPFDKNDLSKFVEAKQYDGTGWTFQNGDYIVKGKVDIQEVSKIKELSDYEVFEITLIDVKDFGSSNMQHFEIRGK